MFTCNNGSSLYPQCFQQAIDSLFSTDFSFLYILFSVYFHNCGIFIKKCCPVSWCGCMVGLLWPHFQISSSWNALAWSIVCTNWSACHTPEIAFVWATPSCWFPANVIVSYENCEKLPLLNFYKQNQATFLSERFWRMVGAGKLRSCPPLASAETLFRFAFRTSISIKVNSKKMCLIFNQSYTPTTNLIFENIPQTV